MESSIPNLKLVLILGSYDRKTKPLLDAVKLGIAERFGDEGTFVFLLDELEVYISNEYIIYVEREIGKKVNLYQFKQNGDFIETYNLVIIGANIDKTIKDFFQNEHMISVSKMPILTKLDTIRVMSSTIILIRDSEKTRGGEIAELIYCIMTKTTNKICFYMKEGIPISQMIMEFLDASNTVMRYYVAQKDLVQSILRYVAYRLKETSKRGFGR